MIRFHQPCGLILALGFLCLPVFAARDIDPLFRITRIEGPCRVRLPGEASFQTAIEGRAYPYGSTVDTGRNASAVVRVGPADRTTLSGFTRVTVDHAETADDLPKVLRLKQGELAYIIPKKLGEENLIRVLTPMASVERIIGKGTIRLSIEAEQLTLEISPGSDSVLVVGPQFSLPSLAGENRARIVLSRDRHYLSLRNLRGTYPVLLNIPDLEEEQEPFSFTPQMVIKFWRRHAPAGHRRIVAGLVSNADGTIAKNFAFVEDDLDRPDLEWETALLPAPEAREKRGWRRLLFWR